MRVGMPIGQVQVFTSQMGNLSSANPDLGFLKAGSWDPRGMCRQACPDALTRHTWRSTHTGTRMHTHPCTYRHS